MATENKNEFIEMNAKQRTDDSREEHFADGEGKEEFSEEKKQSLIKELIDKGNFKEQTHLHDDRRCA